MRTGTIYALEHPITGEIRYIGQTINKNIKARLAEHVFQAKKNNYRVATWIKSLLNNGLRPKIKLLAVVAADRLNDLEIEMIKHYKSFCNLTNTLPGGFNNRIGVKWTDDMRNKMLISGVFEKSRQRMLGDENPGRNRPKVVISKEYIKKGTSNVVERMKEDNPSFKKRIPVFQYDDRGVFIKEWDSATSAGKNLKIDSSGIARCCKGEYGKAKGFIWKYKNTENHV